MSEPSSSGLAVNPEKSDGSDSDDSFELSDYDSSSSFEIVVNPYKLREELAKEIEEEKKKAAAKGITEYYEDGTVKKYDKKGRVKDPGIVKEERYIKKRRVLKAEVMKNMSKVLKKPFVRRALERMTHVIPENESSSDLIRKKVRLTADENCLSVTIIRHSALQY